jgi:organic hydroperoxide reductase OsmC/OhrA
MRTEVTYHTDVTWAGGHRGHLVLGNGPDMFFSAPPDAHGESGVLTPEDAFVAAVNTCVMLMFLWACERFKIDLVSYECRGEGTKRIELDRTEQFARVVLRPRIVVRGGDRKRVDLAVQSAVKYSLVANSIKSQLTVEPTVLLTTALGGPPSA